MSRFVLTLQLVRPGCERDAVVLGPHYARRLSTQCKSAMLSIPGNTGANIVQAMPLSLRECVPFLLPRR
jgi:hypothetical protein